MGSIIWAIAAKTALEVGGELTEGSNVARAADREAKQFEQNANARYADATREAAEERRVGRAMASDARAAQAGSGGVTDDPGAISTRAGILDVGEYNALSALYSGEQAAQSMRYRGRIRREEGRAARRQSRIKALATALGGGMDMFGGGGKGGGKGGGGKGGGGG